jgi:putative transposase
MRPSYRTPPAAAGHPAWAAALADALALTDYSPAAPRAAVARALLLAAALTRAVSAVARRAAGAGRETVRRALRAALPDDPAAVEARLARGLHRQLPRRFGRRPVPIAIDTHLRPYYGDRRRTPGVCGGPRKASAAWFWGYATAVALAPGRRHTLALTAVRRADTPAAVVERVLAQVGWAGVRVRYVLLDRGFYASGVIAALQRRRLRVILPLARGHRSAPFWAPQARGWFDHRVRNRRRRADDARVRVAVCPGPDRRRPLVFACSAGFGSVPRVALRYRRRFGIEASYRQLGECLARTTTRDARVRLVLVGVALLIRAWWAAGDGRPLGDLRLRVIVWITGPATEPLDHTHYDDTQ